jgi:hypothetical protein
MSAHVTMAPPPLDDQRSDVPAALMRLTMKCLEKEPGERYATADDLLADIEHVTPAFVPGPVARGAATAALQQPRAFGRDGGRSNLGLDRIGIAAAGAMGATDGHSGIAAARECASAGQRFRAGRELNPILPNDTSFASLYRRFTFPSSIKSEPAGAKVYRASFDDTTKWTLLGTTPIRQHPAHREGRSHAHGEARIPSVRGMISILPLVVALDTVTAPDSEMVHIAAGTYGPFLVSVEEAPQLALDDFRIDRYEITNRQYKSFVAAGGYTKREFWEQAFDDNGRTLSWEEAMARFKDRTGRPGPATWEAGDFPSAQADFPVSGVSWYEAAAYAKFAGKTLPTIYDWGKSRHGRVLTVHRAAVQYGEHRSCGRGNEARPERRRSGGRCRQCPRMVLQRDGARRAVYHGRWMERPHVRIHQRICPAGDGSLGDQRHPARQTSHIESGARAVDAGRWRAPSGTTPSRRRYLTRC